VLAAGSDRGNEILARLGARLEQPMAANCTEAAPANGAGARVTRIRWGGSVLEEATLDGTPVLLTVAPHALAAQAVEGPPQTAPETFTPALAAEDQRVVVVERVAARTGGVSLTDAAVVVSGGRGVGSTEGFAAIEELAALLGGAVGCSRAVTMAGWRPHSDQVGQTGTKIAPELYIPCGISGATQHMAGCKGAKRLLAINPDAEAPILASADYAVIGDLHTVVPAINAAIKKARET
jgi:electron transfer flavoprotein alpha subunit